MTTLALILTASLTLAAGRTVPTPQRTPAERKWGIAPVSVRPAAGGFMIYFRYRVLDVDKVRPLFRDDIKPFLVDRTTGASLAMPADTKLGGLRSSPRTAPAVGKEYYVLFANSSKAVKKGSKVDVVMGKCRLANLEVQ
jgi:hypothetical protein